MKINIKKLSQLANTPISTIRYYEKIGLLPKAKRGKNNYRIYGQNDVYILDCIRTLTQFNFSLSEIKLTLQVTRNEGYSTEFVQKMINNKLAEFQNKISLFTQLKGLLNQILTIGLDNNDELRTSFEDLHKALQNYDKE